MIANAMLRAAGATATAIYLRPRSYEYFGKLKEGSGSEEPLVAGQLSATDAPAETIRGVQVFQLHRRRSRAGVDGRRQADF